MLMIFVSEDIKSQPGASEFDLPKGGLVVVAH
jgi:hypothetical protein